MFMSVAGVPIDEFKGKGAEFAEAFKPRLGGKEIDPYAIYGAEAAQAMLDAIAASDGSRADVIAKLFETNVTDGYLGTFEINENGDPSGAEGAVVSYDLQGHGQARDRQDDLSEAGERRGGARLVRFCVPTPRRSEFPLGFSPQWRPPH